jgi:amidase
MTRLTAVTCNMRAWFCRTTPEPCDLPDSVQYAPASAVRARRHRLRGVAPRAWGVLLLALAVSAPYSPDASARPLEGVIGASSKGGVGTARFDLVEATIPQMLKAMQTGLLTSEMLVQMYLARIAAYDDGGPALNSYLHVNPNAVSDAMQLDALRPSGIARAPLYGIPVALKDNVDTADMPTTAGSVALAGSIPGRDAFITEKLRDAGAVILGKATLTEFANFLTNGMPAGYSSLGGYGFNPYDPRPLPGGDGRPVLSPGGSSSGPGIAAAANLAAVTIGTETSGSILSPANANGVVGIKPTVGLVSRTGIIPITADQDTAGPLARTVTDAAIVLGVIAGYDPADPATAACLVPDTCFADYLPFLDKKALKGARIAVPPSSSTIVADAVEALRREGAYVELVPALGSVGVSSVLRYGFKRDLNAYLAGLPAPWPIRTLTDIIAFNAATAGALKYGQTTAIASDALDISPGSTDTLTYEADYAAGLASSRGILDAVYKGADGMAGTEDDFDALLNPGAGTPARAGYPSVSVPGGFLPPSGAIVNPFPGNVVFSGPAFSEPKLIALAYAFEQATKHRRPPQSTPPLPTDSVMRP